MRHGRRVADHVVVSLFVNPLQFGPTEDLSRYPRQEERDVEMAEGVGVDVMFIPDAAEIIGADQTRVVPGDVAKPWEGKARPGHFEGVATIVLKLFGVVQPTIAIFGQKDLQQCAVIRQMIRDFHLPIALHIRPTVREETGLAMSSRNSYFGYEDMMSATALAKTLETCASEIRDGILITQAIRRAKLTLSKQDFVVEYLALVNAYSMEPTGANDSDGRLIVAAKFRGVRLIDNVGIREDIR